MKNSENLIDIQTSCVQQQTSKHKGKLDWEVYNEDGEVRHVLSKEFSDPQIFEIQRYVKKFELEGFNRGMEEMDRVKSQEIQELQKKYQDIFEAQREENERISNKLSEIIGASLEDNEPGSKIGIPEHMR